MLKDFGEYEDLYCCEECGMAFDEVTGEPCCDCEQPEEEYSEE